MVSGKLQPTAAIAEFIGGTKYEHLPAEAIHDAKRLILDSFGCALGGYTTEIGSIMTRVVRRLGGVPESTLLGSGERTSCVNAAHANARIGNALDADDTFMCVAHHGVPTVFGALAMGEARHISGRAFLTSVLVGFDVGARVGASVGPPIYDPKTQDVAGGRGRGAVNVLVPPMAATAAAANAARLSPGKIAHALGLAGELTGVGASLKSRRDKFYLSKASFPAQAGVGVESVVMAEEGMTCNEQILDGEQNQLNYLGFDHCNFELMLGQLGKKWYIKDTTYKPWPVCAWIKYPLTAFQRIMQDKKLAPEEIEKVIVRSASTATAPRFCNQDPEGFRQLRVQPPSCRGHGGVGVYSRPGVVHGKGSHRRAGPCPAPQGICRAGTGVAECEQVVPGRPDSEASRERRCGGPRADVPSARGTRQGRPMDQGNIFHR